MDVDDDLEVVEYLENVDIEEVAEKERSSGGQPDRAGDGEIEGDGEGSLVDGGEVGRSLTLVDVRSIIMLTLNLEVLNYGYAVQKGLAHLGGEKAWEDH